MSCIGLSTQPSAQKLDYHYKDNHAAKFAFKFMEIMCQHPIGKGKFVDKELVHAYRKDE